MRCVHSFLNGKDRCSSWTQSPQDILVAQAQKRISLVPIRVEFETDTHRIRDCFAWNIHEEMIRPETFARIFCNDLELPLHPWAETIANQIRAQIEEYQDIAAMELGMDGAVGQDENQRPGDELPECRVILSVSGFVRHVLGES